MPPETESSTRDDVARRHWRRQLVLTGFAIVLVLAASGMTAAALAFSSVPHSALRLSADGAVVVARPADEVFGFVLWPAVAALAAGIALLAVTVVHGVRIASFTFRRQP